MSQTQRESQSEVLSEVKRPRLFRVVLLNDDFTPMDFVVAVLKKFFKKTEVEAQKVMLEVHEKGAGVAGVFVREIAEMKTVQTNDYARSFEHPLKCVMEPENSEPNNQGGG